MDDGRPWIATAPKRGYRFDGAVTLHDEVQPITAAGPPISLLPETKDVVPRALDPAATPSGPQPSAPSPASTATHAPRPRFFGWVLASLLLMCELFAALLIARRPNHAMSRFRVPLRGRSTACLYPTVLFMRCIRRAVYYLNKRSVESVQKSINFFQQAIQAEPNYAAAYAGLADAYALASSYASNSFLGSWCRRRPRPKWPLRRHSRSMIPPQMRTPRWPT